MKKYKVSIPKFEVEVKAKSKTEAFEKAGEIYDDYQSQDPEFGNFIIKEIK